MREYSLAGLGAAANEWANPVHEVTALEGEWVRLRPVGRADYPHLFGWRADSSTVHLWNISRRVVSFEEFVADLERALPHVLLHVVVDRETERLIGYAQAYDVRPWDGHLQLGFYLESPFRGRPHFPESALLALQALFRWYPLRKVYAEVYEFAEWLHPLLGRLGFREEGFTPDHFWHDGRFWGLRRMALYAEDRETAMVELSRMAAVRGGVRSHTDRGDV